MPVPLDELLALAHAVAKGDARALRRAMTKARAPELAAACAKDAAEALVGAGAGVRVRNRRGAEPLHYACDRGPAAAGWDPDAQEAVVAWLIDAGADPNARDKSGVAPIHRAVRTRSTGAVRALLAGGADARAKNKSGSTPSDLVEATTGASGSGSAEAKREQAEIRRLLAHALRA